MYVDYAHTPDALAKALDTVRETRPQALTVVFGCGGDRDRGKRALMGRIAAQYAEEIVVTSDNPRGEDPMAIITDILAGVAHHAGHCAVIESRAHAVQGAIAMAHPGDIVLVAGKGHEAYQEIKGVRHRYSDTQTVTDALARYAA